MKANVEVEIYEEELQEALNKSVSDSVQEELRKMVREQAKTAIQQQISLFLEPLVCSVLMNEKFEYDNGYRYSNTKIKLQEHVKRLVVGYLDEPCFLYSSSSKKPSERCKRIERGTPRLHLFIEQSVKDYFDEHVTSTLKTKIKHLLDNKKELQSIANEQLKAMVDSI